MYIDANTVIKAGSVLTAILIISGVLIATYKWFNKLNVNQMQIKEIQVEQTLICYGILACLKGLKEQGCNGPVTEALNKLEKHLNMAAHEVTPCARS